MSDLDPVIKEYESFCASVAVYPGAGEGDVTQVIYTILGMNGEAGEAADHVKKMLRDDGGVITESRAQAIIKEVGDTLWYVTRAANELGFGLTELMAMNIAKLTQRKRDATLHGDNETRVRDYETKQQAQQLLMERLIETLGDCVTIEEVRGVLEHFSGE